MEINPNRSPSFFKVLIGDFTKKLRIPPAFVRNFKKNFKKCKLKTDDGKSFKVNIGQNGSHYCFSWGWHNFVRYHKLEAGDFVLFWLVGNSTFEVVPYDSTCCPKNLPSQFGTSTTSKQTKDDPCTRHVTRFENSKHPQASASGVDPTTNLPMKQENQIEKEGAEGDGYLNLEVEDPYFVVVLKKYHKTILHVPKASALEIEAVDMKKMALIDEEGRTWPAEMSVRRDKKGHERFDIAKGWSAFRKTNNLGEGVTCMFSFIKCTGNVFHVKTIYN